MEFKLNKIDTDIRKKMQEEIKDDKVHSSKNVSITKDMKDESNKEMSNFNEYEKRYITIDGVKYNNKNIDVEVEKMEKMHEDNSKGRILDTTK